MRTSPIQRLLLVMVTLFAFSFIGYQIYRYFYNQYKTETVYNYTIAETARVSGIVLRKETLLEDQLGSGFATYTASDGTKVSKGSPIAEIYESESDAENVRKLRELNNRKTLLERAQDPGTTSFAHTDVLNKQISSELAAIIGAVDTNSLLKLSDMSDRLLVLMNTKQIATGKQEDFSTALAQLSAEEKYYTARTSEHKPTTITSPRQGYFIRTVDGYENCTDLNRLDRLSAQELTDMINNPAPQDELHRVGKLMTDHNWYYVVLVQKENLEQYREGASVTLDFNISGLEPVPAVIDSVNDSTDEEDVVIVFRCDYINEHLVNLRVTQADVNFKSISGLRVSNSALRFEGLQQGVYVLKGDMLTFRPVTVIYEDVGFSLCREYDDAYMIPGTATYAGLQQYDEIVIEGVQLYDRKQTR